MGLCRDVKTNRFMDRLAVEVPEATMVIGRGLEDPEFEWLHMAVLFVVVILLAPQ